MGNGGRIRESIDLISAEPLGSDVNAATMGAMSKSKRNIVSGCCNFII